MSKAEKFIQDCTRNCSNEIDQLGADIAAFSEYYPWITPDQAMIAVEIAREEVINDFKERVTIFLEGAHEYTDNKQLQMQYDNEGLIRDFRAFVESIKQAMKDE